MVLIRLKKILIITTATVLGKTHAYLAGGLAQARHLCRELTNALVRHQIERATPTTQPISAGNLCAVECRESARVPCPVRCGARAECRATRQLTPAGTFSWVKNKLLPSQTAIRMGNQSGRVDLRAPVHAAKCAVWAFPRNHSECPTLSKTGS